MPFDSGCTHTLPFSNPRPSAAAAKTKERRRNWYRPRIRREITVRLSRRNHQSSVRDVRMPQAMKGYRKLIPEWLTRVFVMLRGIIINVRFWALAGHAR